MDDVYKPHTYEEMRALVEAGQLAPDVFARLDPDKRYGIWWFNRRRTRRTQVAEVGTDGERVYKKKSHNVYRPKEEWVAVPVPDSGVPREWVDQARQSIEENQVTSAAGRRVWELSGGTIHCSECGGNMMIHSVTAPGLKSPGRLFYYRCRKRNRDGADACVHRKCHRADEIEPLVWNLVSGLLKDSERLRVGLEEMIEQERSAMRGDPEREIKVWSEKIAEVDQERRGYLRLAAKGHITDDELDEVLADLEDTRKAAEIEVQTLRSHRQVLAQLERDKDAILESYARMTPEALDKLSPEERHGVYKMLRLKVAANPDGSLEVTGALQDCFAPENQHQGGSLAQDQVHFPVPVPVVALDEVVTLPGEVAQRELLAPRAGEAVVQPPTPA